MEAAANCDTGSQLHLDVELPIMPIYINQHDKAVRSWLVVHIDDFDRVPCIKKISYKMPSLIVGKRHAGDAAGQAACIPLARETQSARLASSTKDSQLISERFRVNRRHQRDPNKSYDMYLPR